MLRYVEVRSYWSHTQFLYVIMINVCRVRLMTALAGHWQGQASTNANVTSYRNWRELSRQPRKSRIARFICFQLTVLGASNIRNKDFNCHKMSIYNITFLFKMQLKQFVHKQLTEHLQFLVLSTECSSSSQTLIIIHLLKLYGTNLPSVHNEMTTNVDRNPSISKERGFKETLTLFWHPRSQQHNEPSA